MSELQDLFEQGNPIPKGVTRCGDHYAQTEYMLIDPYASGYAERFKGFMEGIKRQQAIIDNLKAQLNNMEACYIEKKKQVEDQLNQTKGACGRYDRLYEEYRLLELLVGNYRVLAQEVLPRCSRELLENIEGWEKALRGGS